MDAKPQRPIRTMRVQTDENILPVLPNGKTIHQRNKSSPALSTILAGNAVKMGPKRTAFGDVSNINNSIAHNHRPSKDDSAVGPKAGLPLPAKLGPILQDKQPVAASRPTQRPLSVSNLRGLLSGSNNNAGGHDSSVKVGPVENANGRKGLTKRTTTIFKDSSLGTVQELEGDPVKANPSQVVEVKKSHDLAAIQVPPTEPQLKLDVQRQLSEPVYDPVKDLPLLHSDTDLSGLGEVNLNANVLSSEADLQAVLAGDQSKVNEGETALLPITTSFMDEARRGISIKPCQPLPVSLYEPELQVMPSFRPVAQLDLLPAPLPAPVPTTASQYSHIPSPPEAEEYWDEEEEEAYEEEGYVTARSYRSKGDNTTGGVTTVLFPQWNQKTRREISAAKSLVEATRTAEEIEDECYDTSMVAEYGDEIFDYMKTLEVKMLPNAHYMDNQHEIQWSMRSVLMDWLVQVHHRFNLLPETLFLCVNYIDRFLSCKVVSLGKLQLVGATAIFIAAKYEEINCPSVQEIVYMVDGGYTVDEILKAERFMLTMLQFELGWPGPMSFLRRISKADDYDLETRTLAKYFLEVTVMDHRFIGSPPSFLSAASHCLARLMLRKGTWSAHHIFYSGYTFSQLRALLGLMMECCEDPRKHHAAVYTKYCDKRYKRAAAFVETEMQRGFQLPNTPVVKETVQPPALTYYDASSYFRM